MDLENDNEDQDQDYYPPEITQEKEEEYRKDIVVFLSEQYIILDNRQKPKPIALDPWQKNLLREFFHTYDEDGKRLYTKGVWGMPKKNGKSCLLSGVAQWAMTFDLETNAAVYSAAGDKEQAGIIFTEANIAIQRNPILYNRDEPIFKLPKSHRINTPITIPTTNSVYKVVSKEGFSAHGLNPSAVLFDELWVQTDKVLWDAFLTARGARMGNAPQNPFILSITTAGYNLYEKNGKEKTIAYEEYCEGLKMWELKRIEKYYEAGTLSGCELTQDTIDHIDEDDKESLRSVIRGNKQALDWLKETLYLTRRNHFFWTYENLLSSYSKEYLKEEKYALRKRKRVYQILHQNKWIGGAGTLLTTHQVAKLFDGKLKKKEFGDTDIVYYMGIDIGWQKDRAVVAVGHEEKVGGKSDIFVVDSLETWFSTDGEAVKIGPIEEYAILTCKLFNITTMNGKVKFDPTQFMRSSEELENEGIPIEKCSLSGPGALRLSKVIFTLTVDERLRCYQHEMFKAELIGLIEIDSGTYYKIDHSAGSFNDHMTAIGLAAEVARDDIEGGVGGEADKLGIVAIFIPESKLLGSLEENS